MVYLIKIGIFIVTGFILMRLVNLFFRFYSKKNSVHVRYLKSMVNVLIVAVLLYTLLQQFDITKDVSKTLLQSGSLILAIATFAAQQALGNVISGFFIAISKPFDLGQKVKVLQGGSLIAEGIIQDITIRHTVIRQFNGESCIVPNSVMDAAVVVNTNFTANVGNFLEVEISYESDVDLACELMQAICIAEPLSLNTAENQVLVKSFSQNGVVLKTTVWTKTLDENFTACSNIRKEILKDFAQCGIVIPYQTVKIWDSEETALKTEEQEG